MLKQLQKRKDESGFSIIEVLIVLAIAGLIMVVVFLAVPALNRNSHNNQYKTEGRNLLGAYQELMNNNGGNSPAVSISTAAGSDAANIKTAANTKTLATVNILARTTTAQAPAIGTAVFVQGTKCSAAGSTAPAGITPTTTGASTRSVSMYFQIEAASGVQFQCIDE